MAMREDVIKLVQELPEGELGRVHGLLVALLRGGDGWAHLAEDDEPVSPGEAVAVAQALAEPGRISLDDVRKQLGL